MRKTAEQSMRIRKGCPLRFPTPYCQKTSALLEDRFAPDDRLQYGDVFDGFRINLSRIAVQNHEVSQFAGFDGALLFLREFRVRASERKSTEGLIDRATLLRAVDLPFRAGPVHHVVDAQQRHGCTDRIIGIA